MGTKKKPVKKSKSKSKKQSTAKHVEQNSAQEVPEVGDFQEFDHSELDSAGTQAQSEDNAVPTIAETEKVEEEAMPIVAEECGDDQKVPSLEEKPVEPKPRSVCHQRIEALKQSECGIGGRNSARRKLSLQVASEAAKMESRRVSLADIKQIKHPLQDSWTFWYYMGNKYKQWNENLRQVCKVSTVEDFWCLYNDLICPSQLTPGKDFNFFKKGIRPEWEDAANNSGGMWSFCPRDKNQKNSEMDRVWLEMLMFLIGDQFDKLSRYVNGVSYSKRKQQDRISLWIKPDLSKTKEILEIGQTMKQAVGYVAQSFKLEYSTSEDWKQKTGSSVTVRFNL